MNIARVVLFVLALIAPFLFTGCESTTDPLAKGWKPVKEMGYTVGEMSASVNALPDYKAISDDVQIFVNKLPVWTSPDFGPYMPRYKRRYCCWIHQMTLLENGTGQDAVKIEIPVDGTYQNYVLIYDKNNVRIKTINFLSGHYAC